MLYRMKFSTYQNQSDGTSDSLVSESEVVGRIRGKIRTFKKIFKEFSHLGKDEPVRLEFSHEHSEFRVLHNSSLLSLVSSSENDVGTIIKVPGNYPIDEDIYANYSIGSLRFTFSRYSKENLDCVLYMSQDRRLSVRIIQEHNNAYIETVVKNLEDEAEE